MPSSKLSAVASSLLPLVLSTIAFAFAITTLTSKEWAIRHQYDPDLYEVQWTKPNGTEYRSPFYVCGTRAAEDGSGAEFVCNSFPSPGTNSCLPLNLTGSPSAANYGDERLCQQIHWAGNLAIASTVFIGVGFLVTLCMSLLATLALLSPAAIRATEEEESSSTGPVETKAEPDVVIRERKRPHRKQKYLSPAAPWINGFLIAVLVMGAIMYVLAQFYGIIAFVQSAPNNAAYALYGPGDQDQNPVEKTHGPWIQGKALGVYPSVAWLAAILTALCASFVWRLPSGRQSPL